VTIETSVDKTTVARRQYCSHWKRKKEGVVARHPRVEEEEEDWREEEQEEGRKDDAWADSVRAPQRKDHEQRPWGS
jgi:hypothetical protein